MKELYKRHPVRCLVAGCYAAWLLCLVLVHLVGFGVNAALRANGTLAEETLSLDDFTFVDIERDGNVLITTGYDPQLLLADEERKIDTLRLDFSYSLDPYLVNVFYKDPGEGYSARRMVYPEAGTDGQVFWLPPTGEPGLRIDPGAFPGNLIEVHGITVNEPRPFWAYLRPSSLEVFLLAVGPALLASGISAALEGLRALRARKGAGQ